MRGRGLKQDQSGCAGLHHRRTSCGGRGLKQDDGAREDGKNRGSPLMQGRGLKRLSGHKNSAISGRISPKCPCPRCSEIRIAGLYTPKAYNLHCCRNTAVSKAVAALLDRRRPRPVCRLPGRVPVCRRSGAGLWGPSQAEVGTCGPRKVGWGAGHLFHAHARWPGGVADVVREVQHGQLDQRPSEGDSPCPRKPNP